MESVALEQADLSSGGYGEWKATVSWTYGDPEVAYTLRVNIEYSSEIRQRSAFIGSLAPGEEKQASWRLKCAAKCQNNLTATGRCHVNYDHTDPTIADDADYERTAKIRIAVSDYYVNGSGSGNGGGASGWFSTQSRLIGRILGFAALGMIIASVITGGFPDNKTKVRLNKSFGNAARRVRIHCWISIGVMALSVLHGAVLLLGFYYGRLTGLTLGGISLAAMLGMGLIGCFRFYVSRRIGAGGWRALHLSLAAAALLFALLHTFIDGTTMRGLLGY